jgi:hypothetical protein
VTRHDALEELRTFADGLARYEALLRAAWRRQGGAGWYDALGDDARRELEALRYDLARQYGRLKPAIAEAHGGGLPIIGNNLVGSAGEVFQVALADPSDNPWLSDALDGSRQTAAIAIGYFEGHQREDIVTRTSIAYWWRRGSGGLRAIYREVKDWATIATKWKP